MVNPTSNFLLTIMGTSKRLLSSKIAHGGGPLLIVDWLRMSGGWTKIAGIVVGIGITCAGKG